MKIISGFEAVGRSSTGGDPPWNNLVMAMGNFDGVHLGHQHILHDTLQSARNLKGISLCLTFTPHPAKVLAPEHAPTLIQTDGQKLGCIAHEGIELLLMQPFDKGFAQIEYEDFFERYIDGILKPKAIRVGCRFAFGHDRKGNAENLGALCAAKGIDFRALPEFRLGEEKISSSRIRKLLAQGDLELANRLLGRSYEVWGRVIHGAGRGAHLGFPTANIATENEPLLQQGVYACRIKTMQKADEGLKKVDAPDWKGVANLGVRPTFAQRGGNSQISAGLQPVLEVHIFDCTEALYDRTLALEFVAFLRREKRFTQVQELQAQIKRDCESARKLLS